MCPLHPLTLRHWRVILRACPTTPSPPHSKTNGLQAPVVMLLTVFVYTVSSSEGTVAVQQRSSARSLSMPVLSRLVRLRWKDTNQHAPRCDMNVFCGNVMLMADRFQRQPKKKSPRNGSVTVRLRVHILCVCVCVYVSIPMCILSLSLSMSPTVCASPLRVCH